MKTDLELLADAAKAAGFTGRSGATFHNSFANLYYIEDPADIGGWHLWAPLHDDGDAYRLAVKLNLHVEIDAASAGVVTIEWDFDQAGSARNYIEQEAPASGDDFAATRRAIVRAAAHIGEAMP